MQRHDIAVMIVKRVGKALFRLDIAVYKEDYVHLVQSKLTPLQVWHQSLVHLNYQN
jgi:hypothetical protein